MLPPSTYRRALLIFACIPALVFGSNIRTTTAAAAEQIPAVHEQHAALFLAWSISDAAIKKLARYDVVVLDMEIGALHPEQLTRLRKLHPGIVLLAYISAQEVHKDIESRNPHTPLRAQLANILDESSYAKNSTDGRLSFWPSAWLINITGTWQTDLPQFIHSNVLATNLWDGVMLDNVWDSVTAHVGTDIDLNRDGALDSSVIADAAWRTAMTTMIHEIKRLDPKPRLVVNSSTQYDEIDGIVLENSTRTGWERAIRSALTFHEKNPNGLIIVNATAGNVEAPNNFSEMRYGHALALLTDAAYSFDFGDQKHESLWWYDEYDAVLGAPIRIASTDGFGVWRRDFENGSVFANSGMTTTTFDLEHAYKKIKGKQNPSFNSGKIVNSVTLGPQSGVLLLSQPPKMPQRKK